jgi:phage shock protein A
MRDVKARLGSIESYIATLHGDQTRTSTKLYDIRQRVERLEKRTGRANTVFRQELACQ